MRRTEAATDWITLSEAALLMRVRYQRALTMLLVGEIDGERTERGRWRVRRSSVERHADGRRDLAPSAA